MRHTAGILLLLLLAMPVVANPFGFITALVPINPGTVAGAFGAQWATTLWASNNSDADVKIACQTIAGPCLTLRAHSTMAVPQPYADLTHQGFFISVPSGIVPQQLAANAVSFDLRVTDSVTAPHFAGTEVPLVRPNDFVSVVLLPNVPLNGHSRLKLRVYGMGNGSAAVRVTGTTSNQDLLTTTVTMQGSDSAPPLMVFPSYAEIDRPSSVAGDDAARVEIDGADALHVWGFISITDDTSQQFTIVAPQPLQYMPLSVA